MRKCECKFGDFCTRHNKKKDLDEFLMCVQDIQYRIYMDRITHPSISTRSNITQALVSKYLGVEIKNLSSILEIAVLGHSKEQYTDIEERDYLNFVMLDSLELGQYQRYQNNRYAESRAFLCNELFSDKEYVGTVTASWKHKYKNVNKIDDLYNWDSLGLLVGSGRKDIILCADTLTADIAFRLIDGLGFINKEVIKNFLINAVPNFRANKKSPLGNQIISHRSIFKEVSQFVRDLIDDISSLDLRSTKDKTNIRPEAYLIEMLNILWFSSKDYVVVENEILQDGWYK